MKIVRDGEVLKNTIWGKGLTIADAAKKLGMSRTNLQYYLGKETFDNDFRQKVKNCLGIDIDVSDIVKADNNVAQLSDKEQFVHVFRLAHRIEQLRTDLNSIQKDLTKKKGSEREVEHMLHVEYEAAQNSLNEFFGLEGEDLDMDRVIQLLSFEAERRPMRFWNEKPANINEEKIDEEVDVLLHHKGRRLVVNEKFYLKGIISIPVSMQQEYVESHQDPKFIISLPRMPIVDVSHRVPWLRLFEVNDENMLPTISKNNYLLAEIIERQYYSQSASYYVYVIVTDDRIIVSRIVVIDDKDFFCLNDNEFFPAFKMKFDEVKELWRVSRKLMWDNVEPKKVEIKIK